MAIEKAFTGTAKTAANIAAQVIAENAGRELARMLAASLPRKAGNVFGTYLGRVSHKCRRMQGRSSETCCKTKCQKALSIAIGCLNPESTLGEATYIEKFFSLSIIMFRTALYLEKTAYVQVNLDTPLTYPGNNQTQIKSGHKFTVRDRDSSYRAGNNGRSTDNVRPEWRFVRTKSSIDGHVDRSPYHIFQ